MKESNHFKPRHQLSSLRLTFSEYMDGVLRGLMTTMLGPAYVWMRLPP